jgi:Tfp pilus assembly protein PilF
MARRSSPTVFPPGTALTLALGLNSGFLLASWSQVTASHAGGHAPSPLALGAWVAGLLAGMLGVRRVARVWQAAVLCLGPLLALAAAGLLLAAPGGSITGQGLQVVLALLALGPGAFLAGQFLRREDGRPLVLLGGGMAGALLLAAAVPGPWTVGAAFFIGPLAVAALLLRRPVAKVPPASDDEQGPANPWDMLASAAGAALVVLALVAWSQVLLLLCGGWLPVRLLLPGLTIAGATLGALIGRRSTHLALPAMALSAAAMINLLVAGLVPHLAALSLRVAIGSAGPAGAAALVALLTLFPLALLVGLAWASARTSPGDRPVALAAGALLGLVTATLLLGPVLGPARLLVFAAAALPLGLALPAVLNCAGIGATLRRVVLPVLLVAASLAGFFLHPAPDRLLAAGIGWNPRSFLYQDRSAAPEQIRLALPEILGEQRLLTWWAGPQGLVARRETATSGAGLTWMGWSLGRLEDRPAAAVAAALPALFAGGEGGDAAVVGDRAGLLADALVAVRPELELVRYELLSRPGDAASPAAGRPEPQGVSAWVAGGPYDVIVVQPLPPAVAASGLAWSRPAFARLRQALTDQGVAALRLGAAGLGAAGFRQVVATFLAEFPTASLWFDGQGLVLLGPRTPRQMDLIVLERRFRQAAPALRSAGVHRLADLLARHVMPASALAQLAQGVPVESRFWPRLVWQAAGTGDAGGWSELLPSPAMVAVDLDRLIPGLTSDERQTLEKDLERSGQVTRWWLEMLFLAESDLAAALASGQAALALQPENEGVQRGMAPIAYRAGVEALAAGLMPDARVLAELAVDLDAEQVLHHLLLYDVTLRTRPAAASRRRLQNLARRFPESYPVLLVLARHRLDLGEVNAAEAFLQRAVDTGFDSAALHLGWARVAFARGQVAAAQRQVHRALAMAPDAALVLADLGGSLVATDSEQAANFLRQALQMGTPSAAVTGPLGGLALRAGDYQEAIDLLTAAVEEVPGRARFRLDLGSALLGAGRTAEAVPQLIAARELEPENSMMRLNLAAALVREGRHAEARIELEQVGNDLQGNPVYLRLRQELLPGEAGGR